MDPVTALVAMTGLLLVLSVLLVHTTKVQVVVARYAEDLWWLNLLGYDDIVVYDKNDAGDATPGTRSRIYRSEDRGRTWAPAIQHTAPNSTFWAFGAHAADPHLLFAGTKYGHLFRSLDGGRSWFKEWRAFSEITAVAWTPFVAPVTAHAQSIA